MTIFDSQAVIGVDVAKHEIVAYRADVDQSVIIANERCALKKWLKTLPSGRSIALEATNVYHLETVELAHALGHRVFIVDPGKLNKYRDSRKRSGLCDLSSGSFAMISIDRQGDQTIEKLTHEIAQLKRSIQAVYRDLWLNRGRGNVVLLGPVPHLPRHQHHQHMVDKPNHVLARDW